MYATQPLLPQLRAEFNTTQAHAAATISTLTLGVAIAAPFVGAFADAAGRKYVIVASTLVLAALTFAASTSTSIGHLIAWRFAQGLVMPGIFATTLAYVAEEFPGSLSGRAFGAYIGGNVLGGFGGRYIGALAGGAYGWAGAFDVLAAVTLAGGLITIVFLPPAKHFRRAASTSPRAVLAAARALFTNTTMVATYAIGACLLFTLVGAFTFATFYLAEPPFSLSTQALGNVFIVYLAGVFAAPLSGFSVDRWGNRVVIACALAVSAGGMLLTLAHSLVWVITGLGLAATGIFIAQAAAVGVVGKVAGGNRSSASAWYLSLYYAGGSLGAIVPAWTWARGGWVPTVWLIVGVIVLAIAIAWTAWRHIPRAANVPSAVF